MTSDTGFERPETPSSKNEDVPPPEYVNQRRPLSDDEEEAQPAASKKKGGYDSRIEQILYEHPELQIIITDAGKNHESGGSYIAYTIRTGVPLSIPLYEPISERACLLTDARRIWRSGGDTQSSVP